MDEQTTVNPVIEASWKTALADEFQQPYFAAIKSFLLLPIQASSLSFTGIVDYTSIGIIKTVTCGGDTGQDFTQTIAI